MATLIAQPPGTWQTSVDGRGPRLPPVRFGDHALWFPHKSYQHMANETVLPDAVVPPGCPRNSALVNSKFWTTKFLDPHSRAAVRVLSC
jgi:hypothetical protein